MSEWKEQSKTRRDFRQSRSGPEVIGRASLRKPKACKRNKGQPHEYVWKSNLMMWRGEVLVMSACKYCGKKRYTTTKLHAA